MAYSAVTTLYNPAGISVAGWHAHSSNGTPFVSGGEFAGFPFLRCMHIVETDCAAADEYGFTLDGCRSGTLIAVKSILVSGAAATIQPVIGFEVGFTTGSIQQLWQAPAASGTLIDQVPQKPYVEFTGATGPNASIRVRSTPNAGANNVVHTILMFGTGIAQQPGPG
jgi:hypothetical protein